MSETGGSTFRTAPGLRVEPTRKPVDEKLRDASKMYEKLFLSQMLKAMRSTVHESGFIKQNAAEKLFRDEMDAESVNNWADQKGGVGLADMIYKNLMEKYGVQLGVREAVQKPHGPLAMTGKSDYSGPVRASSPRPDELSLRFDRTNPSAEPTSLLAPWKGFINEKKDLGEGVHLLGISHNDGLSGRLVFRGSTERLNLGQEVQAGEPVGLLSPEAKSFFWNINLAQPLASPAAESAAVAEKKLSTVSE